MTSIFSPKTETGEAGRRGRKSSRVYWQRHKKLAYASGEKPAAPVVKTALRTG